MVRSGWLCAMAVAAGMLAGGPARAAEYYVSPEGKDDAAGTSAKEALRTIGAAALRAGPGDVVNIAPGRYVETVKVAKSGTAEAPVTLRRLGEGEVVVTTPEPDAKVWEEKYALQIKEKSHVVVEGITFRDCAAWILIMDSHHCTVRACVFDGARIYNCMRINNGTFNRVVECTFKRAVKQTGFLKDSNWIPTPGADYIEIFRGSHNNLVEACTFAEINHVAVSISAVEPEKHSPTRNVVRRCVFRDPYWKCLWVHAGQHNVVEDCVCTGRSASFVQLEAGTTIIRRNQFTGYRDSTDGNPDVTLRGAIRMQYSTAQRNRIYSNLFFDNQRTLTNNSYRWEVVDNVFKNNIFYRNGQTILLGFPEYRTKNRNYFIHNVMVGTGTGQKVIQLEKDHYTLKEAEEKLAELYRGNIEADPLFEDEGKKDFRLKAGSPCIDGGAALTATAGAGKGTEVAVEDALYFCDGNGLVEGDRIIVGSNEAVRVVQADYEKNVLRVDRGIAWGEKDPVNLAYEGKGPDIGPYEHKAGR